jgi:hypothetical protein
MFPLGAGSRLSAAERAAVVRRHGPGDGPAWVTTGKTEGGNVIAGNLTAAWTLSMCRRPERRV